MVDYGSGGGPSSSKQSWVCPNDRHLALRAKLRKGWSVKTQNTPTYPPKSSSLDESEQEVIRNVIRRAEEFESLEQERVGRIVERLDNMKRNAVGTGINKCILCGTQIVYFGMLSSSCFFCHDCKKAVCHKCGVECTSAPPQPSNSVASSSSLPQPSASTSKKEVIWRCKICAETREMWKKSGAWFFKGLPRYVLPKKQNPIESKYSPGRRVGYEKSNWARAISARPSEGEDDSSSDEERATRLLATLTKKKADEASGSHYLRHGFLSAFSWFYRVLIRQASRIFRSFSATYC